MARHERGFEGAKAASAAELRPVLAQLAPDEARAALVRLLAGADGWREAAESLNGAFAGAVSSRSKE